MTSVSKSLKKEPVRLLIADDSLVFRRFIRDIFSSSREVVVIGEASNGIEALDMVLKLKPDVILMDMEMPVMDGMTSLQHLMIHCPTPTIMVSSLTAEGTTRSLDALKNGAVGFIGKQKIFNNTDVGIFTIEITGRIVNASGLMMQPLDPDFRQRQSNSEPTAVNRVVFCEDCGGRNIVTDYEQTSKIQCSICGDTIELDAIEHYRRNSFLSVLGGGEDSFRNVLNIVPVLEEDLGGSVMAILKSKNVYLDTLAEYLDSVSKVKVLRARSGMELEAGCCYICNAEDNFCIKPFSTTHKLHNVKTLEEGVGPIDLAMASVAITFKRKAAGVLLSGYGSDGLKGMGAIAKNGGIQLLLNPSKCLSPYLVDNAMESLQEALVIENEKKMVEYLTSLYKNARQTSVL